MLRRQLLFSLFGAFLWVCTSCQKSAPIASEKKVLRIHVAEDPPTLDPLRSADLISGCLLYYLFDGLMRVDPSGHLAPALAEEIEISEDRTLYTFHLRQGFWSTGEPITSYDFIRSWQLALHPASPCVNAYLFYPIAGAEKAKQGKIPVSRIGLTAPDAKTLLVQLEGPCPYFLDLLSYSGFFPLPPPESPCWSETPGPTCPVSGPFLLKEWRHGQELVFEKNPSYWNRDSIHLDGISVSIIPEPHTAYQLYEQGELDLIGKPLSTIPIEVCLEYLKRGLLTTRPVAAGSVCVFNTERPPFHNRSIRQAFALAIHRHELVEHVTQLYEEAATSLIPSVLRGKPSPHWVSDYNPQKARALFAQGLAELGLSAEQFPDVVYTFSTTTPLSRNLAQVIQQQIEEVLGIRVALEGCDHQTFLAKLNGREFMWGQTNWFAYYSDPMSVLERFRNRGNGKNYANWENAHYQELLDQSYVARSPAERTALLEEAEHLLLEETPITPLYHWNNAFVHQPYVTNLQQTPIGSLLVEYASLSAPSQKI